VNLVGAMLVAVLIGAVLPLQGLINARLGMHIGGPVVAAFVSFLVGTAMLGAYLVATRTPFLMQGSLKLPAWVWAGGVFGAIYVACFTLLIPRIGAAGMICLAVLGQVTASLVAGSVRHPAGTQAGRCGAHHWRIAGTGGRGPGGRAMANAGQAGRDGGAADHGIPLGLAQAAGATRSRDNTRPRRRRNGFSTA
jgi:transporter family-2 protein